jgi:hypothetical protein
MSPTEAVIIASVTIAAYPHAVRIAEVWAADRKDKRAREAKKQ